MVRYKNFGTSSQHQTIGSFSFSSQNSKDSTKNSITSKSGKITVKSSSNRNRNRNRRNERSPSITSHETESHDEDDCRDEDEGGSRFSPRILSNDSMEEEEINEGESESLYDMISYNGITDEHSTSVCASYSYSADSSAGISDPQQPPTSGARRAKLSYMGYVPVSPNTAAAMAIKEKRDQNLTHRTRNSNSNSNSNSNGNRSNNAKDGSTNNDSGHTAGEATTNTGSIPSIKVDDTSTSRRRPINFNDESRPEEQRQQPCDSASVASTDDSTSQGSTEYSSITDYVSTGQQKIVNKQKELRKQGTEKEKQQQQQLHSTLTSASVADRTHTTSSVVSSVMPNSCTGHPAMMMNRRHEHQKQQLPMQQQQQPHSRHNKQNNVKNANQDEQFLSPSVLSPHSSSQHRPRTSSNTVAGTSTSGREGWTETVSLALSPLTAGVSEHGMVPPSLNHPSAIMQPHWSPNGGTYQQQYGHQQQQQQNEQQQQHSVPSYLNHHVPHMYPYGPSGTIQQYPQHLTQPRLQPGFFPRTPGLARQLHAFHQYHNNPQEQQPTHMATQVAETFVSHSPEEPHSNEVPVVRHGFEPVIPQNNGGATVFYGPDGRLVMNNVKFVKPTPTRKSGNSASGANCGSLSSHSRAYVSSYNRGDLGVDCVQYPKCKSYLASFLNTCGSIVNHGYHVDNSKSSSKEKRAKFGMVAEKSIAGLTHSRQREHEGGKDDSTDYNGISSIGSIGSGLNDAFAANAKKIFHAGNNIMSTLPTDFQNLTQSAAYHNVFDTFQKYTPVTNSVLSEDSLDVRSAVSDDPNEVQAAKGPKEPTEPNKPKEAPLSPISAQREHFKKLRRRRNRGSDTPVSPVRNSLIRRSTSEPNPALSPTSPKSANSKDKDLEASFQNFKERYTRNLHTRIAHEKVGKFSGEDDIREPEGTKEEPLIKSMPNKDPIGSKDDQSDHSWATPMSQEEEEREGIFEKTKTDNSSEPESTERKPSSAGSLEEVLGASVTEDVLMSTSSGMSDSLVGSDVGNDDPQLDCEINRSLSDSERQENTDVDEEHLLLDSFDQNEFPYTPLDVIEEGSEDDDTAVNPPSIKNSSSKDLSVYGRSEDGVNAPMNEQVVDSISSDMKESSNTRTVHRTSLFSVVPVFKLVFVTVLISQCGNMVDLWEQMADQIRSFEGGPEAMDAAVDVVSHLKASGTSFVTAAQGMIIVDSIDLSVEDVISEIEQYTASLMGTADQFLAGLNSPRGSTVNDENEKDDDELQLFHQLVDNALGSVDDFEREAVVEEGISNYTRIGERKNDWVKELEDAYEDAVEK